MDAPPAQATDERAMDRIEAAMARIESALAQREIADRAAADRHATLARRTAEALAMLDAIIAEAPKV